MREPGCYSLYQDADQALSHDSVTSQLFVDITDNCGRDRKAKTLITAVLAEQEGIDSDQLTFDVQQWPPLFPGLMAASVWM